MNSLVEQFNIGEKAYSEVILQAVAFDAFLNCSTLMEYTSTRGRIWLFVWQHRVILCQKIEQMFVRKPQTSLQGIYRCIASLIVILLPHQEQEYFSRYFGRTF